MCLVNVCTYMHAVPTEKTRRKEVPGVSYRGLGATSCRCWEAVPLTIEPSLQPEIHFILECMCV